MNNILLSIALISTPLLLNSCATSGGNTATNGVKSYSLETCIVTDSKLGSMGDPVTKVYNGQEIKFCCAPCIRKFERNPQEYLTKLNRSIPSSTAEVHDHSSHDH